MLPHDELHMARGLEGVLALHFGNENHNHAVTGFWFTLVSNLSNTYLARDVSLY